MHFRVRVVIIQVRNTSECAGSLVDSARVVLCLDYDFVAIGGDDVVFIISVQRKRTLDNFIFCYKTTTYLFIIPYFCTISM